MQIHAASVAKKGDIDWEAVVKLSEGFNGVCTSPLCDHVAHAPHDPLTTLVLYSRLAAHPRHPLQERTCGTCAQRLA